MTRKSASSYIEFAELIRANITGPIKYELIRKAQARLLSRLKDVGVLDCDEADEILI